MNSPDIQLPPSHQLLLSRFVEVCQADDRVVAAFLHGSYATGTADAYSDIDLGLVTTDAAYQDFLADRASMIRQLGEPVFLEHFNRPHLVFFILADGVEGELAVGRESAFHHIHTGPYRVLLDKKHMAHAGSGVKGVRRDEAGTLPVAVGTRRPYLRERSQHDRVPHHRLDG